MSGKTGLICLTVVFVSAGSAWADVYDAVSAFPTVTASTSAQNGVWSYGYATTLDPLIFSLDTTATTDYFGNGVPGAGFYTPTSGVYGTYNLPTVLKNVTGAAIPYGVEAGTIGPWPANLLLMHPGPAGDYSVVRFTAPASAKYVVTGEFLAIGNFSGQTTDSVNLTTGILSSPIVSTVSSDTPYTFNFSQNLLAGQSLDFAVGLGPAGQFYYDSTGFDATISQTPEPGFYGILALGLACLAYAAQRRRQATPLTPSEN